MSIATRRVDVGNTGWFQIRIFFTNLQRAIQFTDGSCNVRAFAALGVLAASDRPEGFICCYVSEFLAGFDNSDLGIEQCTCAKTREIVRAFCNGPTNVTSTARPRS